jgi:elongation factor P
MASVNEISKGLVIKQNGELFVVTDFQHVNPGKGAAFVRTRLQNIKTGKGFEVTLKSNESVEIVEVERRRMQYLYKSGEMYALMDNSTYEQIEINESLLGDKKNYLKEGIEVSVSMYEGAPVAVELPRKIAYKVIDAPPGVRGDTAGGNVTKEITLENGLKAQAPLFIKEGEEVIINTETGEYVERA